MTTGTMDNAVTFVSSTRGKVKACNNGYVYYFDKQSKMDKKISFYLCEEYRKLRCPARVHIRDNEVIDRSKEHNHAPDSKRKSVLNVLSAIKTKASTSTERPVAIVSDNIAVVPPAIAASLPTTSNLRRTIQRVRQRQQVTPRQRDKKGKLDEITSPQRRANSADDEQYLLYNSGPGDESILIFGTQKLLQFLKNSSHWSINGIHDIAPILHYRLITIHATSRNRTIATVYALISANSKHCYSLLLGALNELLEGRAPRTISCDFDEELMKISRLKYPDATLSGSHFNLRKTLFRKIHSLGYASTYQDQEFAIWVGCMLSLAFVSVDDVVDCFKTLTENEVFKRVVDDPAEDLVDYFEDTLIGRPRPRHGGRKKPTFPIDFWNVRDRTIQGLCFSDHVVEEWNHRMLRLDGIRNSNIFVLIGELQVECIASMKVLEQSNSDIEPNTKRIKSENITDRISELLREYDSKNIVQFLRDISHSLKS